MIKKDFFSIIIPAYNSEKYIAKTLDSVFLQTYKKFEVIVINDASEDSTGQIINFYKKKYKIKLVTNKKNLGSAKSRNIGLNLAKGNFISFLDSDDFWEANMLQEHFDHYKKGYELVYTSYRRLLPNNYKKVVYCPIKLKLKNLYCSNFIANSSASYNRVALGLFKYKYLTKVSEDYIYWIDIFKKNPKNIGIQKILLNYRVQSSSMSSNKFKTFYDVINLHYKYLNHNIFEILFYICCWIFFGLKKRIRLL